MALTLLMVFCNLLDIVSTEWLIHRGLGAETNSFAARLQSNGGIWPFRLATIAGIVAIMALARLSATDYRALILDKGVGLGPIAQLRLCMMLGVLFFSTSRAIAGLSNLSGALTGASIPRLAEALGLHGGAIYAGSVFIGMVFAGTLIAAGWNVWRGWEERRLAKAD